MATYALRRKIFAAPTTMAGYQAPKLGTTPGNSGFGNTTIPKPTPGTQGGSNYQGTSFNSSANNTLVTPTGPVNSSATNYGGSAGSVMSKTNNTMNLGQSTMPTPGTIGGSVMGWAKNNPWKAASGVGLAGLGMYAIHRMLFRKYKNRRYD